jgi:hypothetical protein
VTAPLAFCGVSPAASRDDLAACLRPGPTELVDAVAALLPLDPVPPDDALISALDTAHAERENGPIPLGPRQATLLLHAVGVTRVRDTCCAWHDDAAWWLWTDLLHATPPGWVTPAATLLAVTALQRGEATLAQLATDHALAADPGYRLAQLVAGLIEAAIHPRLIRDAMAYAVREAAAEAGAVRRHADHPHPTTPDTPTGTATDATDTTKETPMGNNATIEPGGYVTVDVNAWLDQRTGGPIDELTADLHRWADTHPDSDPDPDTGTGTAVTPAGRNWTATARSWCQDSGFELAEAELIAHIETRLDAEVWILRAQAPASGPIAVVGVNNQPPAVYADACTDSWYWFDADSVDITCPDGHGWTWSTGRELVTADGSFTTLTVVFGPDLDAPFTPCPHCRAYQTGQRSEPCGCGGAPWIICPICGRRCDVELPTW